MKSFLKYAALSAVLCTVSPAAVVANNVTASPEQVRSFIRHHEATGNYDRYYAGIPTSPPRPLTQMTVGEVMAWQDSLRNLRSTAVGAYQIIKNTLRMLVRDNGIDRNALFDQTMQDHLADLLLAECEPQRRNVTAYGNCIARIWAAFPLLSGPEQGKSVYHGIAGNRALTTPQNVVAMLGGDGGILTPLPEGGASVLTYRERVAHFREKLEAERREAGALVWNNTLYSN
jgi:hypothetical protein